MTAPRTLADWLDLQTRLHPQAVELGLERVAAVWARLSPGPLPCPVVTVGGTNGKGSCVAMIEAMAGAAGLKVGAYTSPHLLRYNERVRLHGVAVCDEPLCAAFERVEAARAGTPLTYFEYGTLAALDLFRWAGLDLAVLEVGLGGRLDAVNVLDADVAVIASIGRDHMAWLGDSLEAIAREKAGIVRPGRPAILGQPDAPEALREEAQRRGARVLQVGREIGVAPAAAGEGWTWSGPDGERLALPAPTLRGRVQYHNAAAAVAALRALRERLAVPVAALRAGLIRARLPGRLQVVPGEPTWVLDVAHNPEAAAVLAEGLRGLKATGRCTGRVRAVLGVLGDKEPEAIVAPLIPLVDAWVLSQSGDARAMPAETLARRLGRGPDGAPLSAESSGALPPAAPVRIEPSLDRALDRAEAAADPGDCLLVFGSFTTVAAALARLGAGGETGILAP